MISANKRQFWAPLSQNSTYATYPIAPSFNDRITVHIIYLLLLWTTESEFIAGTW